MTSGAVLLIDVGAGEKIGFIGRKRRLILGALPDRSGQGLVHNELFHRQRVAFCPHDDSAASNEEITSQQDQTDSKNKTEEKFNHRLANEMD